VTGIDYPDLAAAAARSVEELLPRARADLEPVLARSRRSPLPPSPEAGSEPGDSAGFLASCAPPARAVEVPPRLAGTGAPHELGVADLLTAFAGATLTPAELLAALRERWADKDLAGGAILAEIDGADAAAAESGRRWRTGEARPLEGIPFAVKDIIDVAGAPVTSGSHTTGDRIAPADATVVARLRAAGAIPVLMTATTEFACGAPHNARYGVVTNPWDRERWTGGSSTGSAGALAARLVPLALGTDTGGSIRVPSAFCNLTGIKPTYELVPRAGVACLSWTLDHVGPMARSAADLRLVLPQLTERYPAAARPAPLRVGVAGSWFRELCDSGVLAAFDSTVDTLRTLGAELVPVELGDLPLINDDLLVVLVSELASTQESNLDSFELFDIGTQVRIARGFVPAAADYLRSLRRRAGAQREAVRAMDEAGVDLVLAPGIGSTAALLSDVTVELDGTRHPMQAIIGRNTGVFDYLGLPVVMAPAGFVRGLPAGVQIAGRPWADEQCLRLAELLQSATGHHLRGPECGGRP